GPYVDATGRLCGLIGISRDISDRKRLEGDLREAVRVRDEFLSIASHELRTPLTTLALQLDSLHRVLQRGGKIDDRASGRKVDVAARQASRLTTLVDGLLDVSRISLGRLLLELEEFDLAALVRDLRESLADEAARVGCHIAVTGHDSILGCWDKGRIEQ